MPVIYALAAWPARSECAINDTRRAPDGTAREGDGMRMGTSIVLVVVVALGLTAPSSARTLGERRKAAWMSVGHPGLGEYYNAGWGDFFENCPQKKFWLGLIPLYGWPGYLQILSAIDAYHERTSDNLTPVD